jgi:CubicO group peptidase (beta-lactamase class C family)
MRARTRAAVLVSVCVLGAGCTSRDDPAASASAESGGPPAERDYWPTDGWRTADPGVHGFDADELAEVERLVDETYTSVRSILVVRDGALVYERYSDGVDASDGHDVRSVTKSVVSALVGIALADGFIESLDQAVGELLADHLPPDADPRMAGVTVRQLLSMTSGLPADDPTIAGDPTISDEISRSSDPIRASLGLPLSARPGAQWAYSNATSDLLAVIVADATGSSLLDFARKRLFGPLGIETAEAYEPAVAGWPPTAEQIERFEASAVAWPTDAQGYHWGSGGLKLPARDLAKIGFLYLNEGRWAGEQIVPADYVRASTTPGDASTGSRDSYGYQWWITRDVEPEAYSARGYGGQVIEVVPGLDLVAVVTADPEVPRGDGHTLVYNFVVPAAED